MFSINLYWQIDIDFQQNTSTIKCHWKGFLDTESAIAFYRVGLGNERFVTNLRALVHVGLSQGKLTALHNIQIYIWRSHFIMFCVSFCTTLVPLCCMLYYLKVQRYIHDSGLNTVEIKILVKATNTGLNSQCAYVDLRLR